MIYHDHEQGSALWLASRCGVITASRFKDARDRTAKGLPSAKCSSYAAQVAVERIAKVPVSNVFETWQMREGKEQEPMVRLAYEQVSGNIVQEVGFITTDCGTYGYSPDGEIEEDGLQEIKVIMSAEKMLAIWRAYQVGDYKTAFAEYLDQCNGGLWLTARKWIDLVIWCRALEPVGKQLLIHRIHRDETEIEALESELIEFTQMVKANELVLRQPLKTPAWPFSTIVQPELQAA